MPPSSLLRIPTTFGHLAADLYENNNDSSGIFIICHGLLNNRHSKVVNLFNNYILSCTRHSTCLMDFRGNGDSSGETNYGNYSEEADDLLVVAQYLTANHSSKLGPVIAVAGHSKAASVVLIFMDRLSSNRHSKLTESLRTIVMLSGRFNMSERQSTINRFSRDQLDELQRTGQFVWRQYRMADGTERAYVITQESLDRRHSTDMHAFVLRLSATEAAVGAQMESRQPLSVLIVHGTADTVVPVQDACEYYQLFTSETAISPYLRCRLFLMDCVDHFYSGVTVEQLRNLIGWDFYSK